MKKEEMFEGMFGVARELCMENLREKDGALKFTGKYKKCYDYLAEQFILNYIKGKSLFDLLEDIRIGKFYNTWAVFLCMVNCVVSDGKKWFKGIEDIINNSGISEETWVKFLD